MTHARQRYLIRFCQEFREKNLANMSDRSERVDFKKILVKGQNDDDNVCQKACIESKKAFVVHEGATMRKLCSL